MDLHEGLRCVADSDIAGLHVLLSTYHPDGLDDSDISSLIRFAVGATTAMPRLSGSNGIFAASIAAIRNFWLHPDSAARDQHRINRRTIGLDYDFLGLRPEREAWSIAMALNFLLMNRVRPHRHAAVVGTMRDDGIYALEWIAHHLTLGFEGIFIYTNDNADGSEHLLRRLADHHVITLIESKTDGSVRPEAKAFDHALHLLHDLRDYEWVLFVDSDEFFVPGDVYDHDVTRVLRAIADQFPDRQPAAILFEWLWYNSAMVFERKPGSLMERFQYARPHWLTKPLVRIRGVSSLRQQHVPDILPGEFVVNSIFHGVDETNVWNRREPEYEGGRINHYWPKSFEEFSLKKARGDAINVNDEYRRDFRLFFDWNGPETPDTHWPADAGRINAINATIEKLRSLDGVAVLEAAVQRRFRELLRRYDSEGGLATIYRSLSALPVTPSLPTS